MHPHHEEDILLIVPANPPVRLYWWDWLLIAGIIAVIILTV